MIRRLLCAAIGLTLAVSSQPGHAQQRSPALVAAGSVAGAAIAGLVGGLVGGSVTSRGCETGNPDACLGESIPGFLWGAGAGMSIGAPVGAHLVARPRGNLALSGLVSAAIFVAEVIALNQLVDNGRTQHKETVRNIAIAAPVLQVISSVIIERQTGR